MKTKTLFICLIGLFFSTVSFAQENFETKSITKQELLDARSIADILSELQKEGCQITNFKLTVIPFGRQLIELEAKDQFSDRMRDVIKSLRVGDKLYFEYIKCKLQSRNVTRQFHPISFVIVEK